MTPKTCLRCDWDGETNEPTCPDCGAQPLYVAGPSVSEASAEPVGGRAEKWESDPGPSSTDPLEPARRSEGPVVAFVLVALVTVMVVTSLKANEPPTAAAPSHDDSTASIFSSIPSLARTSSIKPLPTGRHAVNVDGVPFSFRVRRRGWERFEAISINTSTDGPQAAEAIIFWTGFPDGDHADPCTRLLGRSVGSSTADLAAAVSTAPGTELVTGPSDVVVGGRPAKHVVLTVRDDVGCDPGFFYAWNDVKAGALWTTTGVGSTIRVWIVDVDGTRLFIEAATTKQAGPALEKEVHRIVRSLRFHEVISVVVPNP
jgi:hypothetical protein